MKKPASKPPLPLALPEGYADWLSQLKGQIAQARQRAALAVNAELVQLYGRIGRDNLQRQQTQGWGAKVIDHLARDLKDAFPDMRGWSPSNLKYMRFFALHCPDGLFGQQPADQLPWFHIVTLLTQLDNALERNGMRRRRRSTAGHARRWRCTSTIGCISVRAARSRTFRRACLRPSRRWPARRSRTRTCSTSWAWAMRPISAKSKTA